MKHLKEEHFFNKDIADAIRILVKEGPLDIQEAVAIIEKLEEIKAEDIAIINEMACRGAKGPALNMLAAVLSDMQKDENFATGGRVPGPTEMQAKCRPFELTITEADINDFADSTAYLVKVVAEGQKAGRLYRAAPAMLEALVEYLNGGTSSALCGEARRIYKEIEGKDFIPKYRNGA